MGEVYRARDTRLDRTVALKVLPEDFFEDPGRKSRFEREAKLLAALSHPNIAAVYSFEEAEGRHLLAMELLDGETLRSALDLGPFPRKRALDIAVQMASALAAAHEKGIIHRDVKPENVFLTREGRAKLLDFGIARQRPPAAAVETVTPTLTATSEPGTVVGTVGYMSPEQVLGRPLDARTDLFSLGVVLYEMLSGKRPFQRQTAPETMAAILREDPPELSGTNRSIPPGLERIVRHCLEKEPSARFQSARDVAFALESLSEATTGGTVTLRARSARRWVALVFSGSAVAASIAFGALLHSRLSRPQEPRFQRLTFQRGRLTGARFLSDGQTVVYSATWGEEPVQLYAVRLDSPEARPLGFRDASVMAISKTSDVALNLITPLGGRSLAVAPFSGGTPRVLAEGVAAADFSPDGGTLAAARSLLPGYLRGADNQLEYPIGTVVYREPGVFIDSVRVSPRGDQVAFVKHPRGDSAGAVMVVAPGSPPRKLSSDFGDIGGLAWASEGREVFFTAARKGFRRDLQSVDLNGRERRVHGGPGSILLQDVARDGRILVSTLDRSYRIFAGGADPGTNRELSCFDHGAAVGLSHDGKVVLVYETGEAAGYPSLLLVRRTDGSPATRIGRVSVGESMFLSPNGRFVLITRARPPAIEVIPVEAGTTRTVSLDGFAEYPGRGAGLLSDDRTVFFIGAKEKEGLRFWTVDVPGGTPKPDSREIARWQWPGITPDETSFLGRLEGKGLALLPRSGGDPRLVTGVSDGDQIAGFSGDGRHLFAYRLGRGPSHAVRRVDVVTGKSETIFEIRPPDPVGAYLQRILVTPDGRHHAYTNFQGIDELHVIEGLR